MGTLIRLLRSVAIVAVGMMSAVLLYGQQAPDQPGPAQQRTTDRATMGGAAIRPVFSCHTGSTSPNATTSRPQTFSGTIVKCGERYMLQDADSGATYYIDRQDLAKHREGKKVRIWGTLEPNGKLIDVYPRSLPGDFGLRHPGPAPSHRRQCRLLTHPGDFCAQWICN